MRLQVCYCILCSERIYSCMVHIFGTIMYRIVPNICTTNKCGPNIMHDTKLKRARKWNPAKMYSTENKSDPKIMRDPNLKHPKMECSKKNSARNSFFPKNSQFQTKTSQRKSHPTGPESTRKCPNCVDRKKFGFRKHPKFWCFCPKISTQKKHCRTRQVS